MALHQPGAPATSVATVKSSHDSCPSGHFHPLQTPKLLVVGAGLAMSASLVVPDGAEAMPEEKVRQLKQAFTLLDKSGDGSIKPKDLKAFMESLGHECTEVELEDMVSDCNTPCTRTPRTHTCPPARPCTSTSTSTSTAISSTAHLAPRTHTPCAR